MGCGGDRVQTVVQGSGQVQREVCGVPQGTRKLPDPALLPQRPQSALPTFPGFPRSWGGDPAPTLLLGGSESKWDLCFCHHPRRHPALPRAQVPEKRGGRRAWALRYQEERALGDCPHSQLSSHTTSSSSSSFLGLDFQTLVSFKSFPLFSCLLAPCQSPLLMPPT